MSLKIKLAFCPEALSKPQHRNRNPSIIPTLVYVRPKQARGIQAEYSAPELERQRVQGGKNACDLQVSNGEEAEEAPPLLLDGATSPLGPKRFPESLAKH